MNSEDVEGAVLDYTIVSRLQAGQSRVRITGGKEIFTFSKMLRLDLRPTHPPI